ncbi:lipopolysaccharide biosynthesis protein [Streptomyces sp. NPDC002577]
MSLVVNLMVIRVVARSLEPGEFGLWLNLTTVFGMLVICDFGVGLAVMGQVSAASGHNDSAAMRRVVSTAFFLLTGCALVGLALSGLVTLAFDWNGVLGVGHEVPGALVHQLLFAVAATAALSLPLTVAGRVYHALQRGHVPALHTSFGVVVQAAGLLGVAVAAPDVRWFFAAYLMTSLIAGITTTVLLLARPINDLRPRLHDVDRHTCGRLAREGVQLFLLSMIGLVAYKSDAILIGHYLGASRVAEYVLPFTLFALVPTFAGVFLTPLWAAYREAWARGDHAWVRSAYVRSVVLATAVGALAANALVAVTPRILRVWIGDDVAIPPMEMLVALACYVAVMCASSAVSIFLNGAGVLRSQMVLASVMAVLNVLASIWSVTRLGLAGPLWSTVVTQTLVVLVPCMFIAHRRLSSQVS